MAIDLNILKTHSKLFNLLDEQAQKELLRNAHEEIYAEEHILMKEGQIDTRFYVILEGSVKVEVDDLMGPKEVARLGKGSFVGEMAALLGEPRSASVIAVEKIQVLVFESTTVKAVLDKQPLVRDAIVKLALKRSEETLEKLQN